MERSEYNKLDRVEDRMWWFAGLHRNLLTLARRVPIRAANLPVLDAGCGTGGLLARLAETYSNTTVLGLELDAEACTRAARKSARPVCAGSVNELPFADGAFAAIFSADVLCHRRVDERAALCQFHRCLTDRGWLILNLPAYRWMMSGHDAAVCNVRRYTMRGLAKLLQMAGFHPVYMSYWNAFLFPLMMVTRKLSWGHTENASDVKLYPRPVDLICEMTTRIETTLLRAGLRFSFGGSVLVIAKKGGTPDC